MPDMERLARDVAGAARARIRRGAGLPVAPRLITLNVTDRCNARCILCDIPARRPAGVELTRNELETFFSDPALHRLDVLRITGGEPFLRPDLADIVTLAQHRTPVRIVYITTNGLLPDRVEAFAHMIFPARAALHIQVSLDAPDARHDAMRGVADAHLKARDTLERLAALKQKYSFHFGINQTVVADNLDQIEPVHELALGLGAGHSIILGARHHEGKNMTGAMQPGAPLPFETQQPLTREQIEEFYATVERLKGSTRFETAPGFSALLREMSEAYLNEGGRNRLLKGTFSPAPPCMALFAHARVLPHGDVGACSVYADQPIGNLRQAPFASIWRSAAAARVRRTVRACPGCWIECDIQPSIFYSGDIVRWAFQGAAQESFVTAELKKLTGKKRNRSPDDGK